MSFLRRENRLVESLTPGLLMELEALPFANKEKCGKASLEIFREANGAGLIIPKELGGMGTSALQAVRFQRALGAVAPSLALAVNMHHFTVALLHEYAVDSPQIRYLLKNTASSRLYLASGFAEGATSQSTLSPKMIAKPKKGGYLVSGSKKPCSLAYSMDVLTASVKIPHRQNDWRFGVAIIPANSKGLSVKPFWKSPILAGAESEEVILDQVQVSEQNMFLPGEGTDLAAKQAGSFIWFQILVSSTYLGVGSALLQQVILRQKGSVQGRVDVACELEGAMAMLEGVAVLLQSGERGDDLIARSLFVRYSVQQVLVRMVSRAAEMLGGVAFLSSSEISYLMSAVRCLAFHPPSKAAVSQSLDDYLQGKPFRHV
jgi:alkylation response protein AidB-like acyl-CoA dehydrogenase